MSLCECRISFLPQAACFCAVDGTLCGSDGLTYDNLCQLTSTAVKLGTKITVQNKGPCRAGKIQQHRAVRDENLPFFVASLFPTVAKEM